MTTPTQPAEGLPEPEITQADRELLASVFPDDAVRADWAMKPEFDGYAVAQRDALRAIAAARRQGHVADDAFRECPICKGWSRTEPPSAPVGVQPLAEAQEVAAQAEQSDRRTFPMGYDSHLHGLVTDNVASALLCCGIDHLPAGVLDTIASEIVRGYHNAQPPAEAQAQGGGESVPVAWRTRHRDVDWSFTTRPHPGDIARGIWQPLYAAPPSAPVGVDRPQGDQLADIVADWFDKKISAEVAMVAIRRHLERCYMQPANDYNRGWVAGADCVTARVLAQQPAAVDGAIISAATRLVRKAVQQSRTTSSVFTSDVAALAAALATQHQEPTT